MAEDRLFGKVKAAMSPASEHGREREMTFAMWQPRLGLWPGPHQAQLLAPLTPLDGFKCPPCRPGAGPSHLSLRRARQSFHPELTTRSPEPLPPWAAVSCFMPNRLLSTTLCVWGSQPEAPREVSVGTHPFYLSVPGTTTGEISKKKDFSGFVIFKGRENHLDFTLYHSAKY